MTTDNLQPRCTLSNISDREFQNLLAGARFWRGVWDRMAEAREARRLARRAKKAATK